MQVPWLWDRRSIQLASCIADPEISQVGDATILYPIVDPEISSELRTHWYSIVWSIHTNVYTSRHIDR